MSNIVEKSLIIRKETKFDKMRKSLFLIFFREEYYMNKRIDELLTPKKIDTSKIVIPKEIGKGIKKYEKYKRL